jgi:hypothetical protein
VRTRRHSGAGEIAHRVKFVSFRPISSHGTSGWHQTEGIVSMRFAILAAAAALLTTAPARAIDLADGKLFVDGSGGAAYGITNHNIIQGATLESVPGGTFRNSDLNLNITARPETRITIAGQISFADTVDGAQTGLDWAFAQYAFLDALKFRAGKIRMPFGLSAEVDAIGTLRPFYSLAPSIYGSTGVASSAFFGAGITGTFALSGSWELSYDAYGGEMQVAMSEPFQRIGQTLVPGSRFEPEASRVHNLLGGRLSLTTPIEGLLLRVSGYRGKLAEFGDNAEVVPLEYQFDAELVSLEYQTEKWLFRAEVLHSQERERNLGGYVEVAYRLDSHWQVAGRVDVLDTYSADIPGDSSLRHHRGLEAGVNYWFSPRLVVKAAYADVVGNRVAFPEHLDDALLAGNLGGRTRGFTLGTQFSF